MSQRSIVSLFKPTSVAVIGASDNPTRAGRAIMRNLLSGGFSGPIMPVTPKYTAVMGVLAYPNIEALPVKPDLAIICTADHRVPSIIERLAQFGCKAAIIIPIRPPMEVPTQSTEPSLRCEISAKQSLI